MTKIPKFSSNSKDLDDIDNRLSSIERFLPNYTIARYFFGAVSGAFHAPAGFNIIPLDSTHFDLGNNLSFPNYVVPQDGYYQVNGTVASDIQNNPQNSISYIAYNGSEIARGDRITVRGGTAGDIYNLHVSDIIYCLQGATLSLGLYNGGANSVTVEALSQSTFMSISKIG